MAALRLQQVWKRYGAVTAVENLSLDCRQGEMLALLGPSGCGKSSTLKMIAGIEPLSSGTLFFDDREVSGLTPGARDIAMVFEDYSLYPHLSVFDNIAFPLRVRGLSVRRAKPHVDEILDLLGLSELAHTMTTRLSGGAQQRVAIGRALVRRPELILFDEPLSHLDADQKARLRTEIKRLQQGSGLTSLLVTHDQTEAIAMADRIAVMNHGVLQQLADPQTLYDRPANLFVANFIGEPPLNQLPASYSDGALRLDGTDTVWPWATDRRLPARLIAGVRPEHVQVLAPTSGPDTLPATVELREPRGDSDVLRLIVPGSGLTLSAEVSGPSAWRAGDKTALRLPADRLLLFDAASGANLLAAA